ncbi:unnamed protein product, partial [Nesidiocoris tenuis]
MEICSQSRKVASKSSRTRPLSAENTRLNKIACAIPNTCSTAGITTRTTPTTSTSLTLIKLSANFT